MTEPPIRETIHDLLRADTPVGDDAFNEHALASFAFQFEHNHSYRQYCERRGIRPGQPEHWLDVPAVPTAAFKEARLVAGDAARAQAVFRTSGTTQGREKRGAHHVLDLELYRASLLPAFKKFVLPDAERMRMASLIPRWQGGDSSLGYMASVVLEGLGTSDSMYAINASGLTYAALDDWLRASTEPACLIGTSLAFAHWLDYLRDTGNIYSLPAGSRVMDTGGFKGSERAISSAGLRSLYEKLLGIPAQYVINEYGMTEMLSQFYDAQLQEPAAPNIKAGPDWVRTAVVDPETLAPLPPGQTGLLRHFDLANIFSVCAIQTEDTGREVEHGFELLGRAAGAAPRGCSIAMDFFLSANTSD